MSTKRHPAEEIVNKLRQADVELGRGKPVAGVCRLIGTARFFRVLGCQPSSPAVFAARAAARPGPAPSSPRLALTVLVVTDVHSSLRCDVVGAI